MEMTQYFSMLHKLVSIPTVSPMHQENKKALERFLSPFGFRKTECGLFVRGNPQSKTWVYSHADTKPPKPENSWSSDPFQLTELQGKWYGLGISDAKFQLLNAILLVPHHDCFFIIDCEEECNGDTAGLFMSQHYIDTLIIVDGARGQSQFYEGMLGQADGIIMLNTYLEPQHPGRKSESALLTMLHNLISEAKAAPFSFHITGIQSDFPERSLTLETLKIRFDIRFIKQNEGDVQKFLRKWNAELKQWIPSLCGRELFDKDGKPEVAPFSNPLGRHSLECRRIIVCPGALIENGNHRPNEFIYPDQVVKHQQSLRSLFYFLSKEGVSNT